MTVTVERIVTSGIFSLDGQDFGVDNNVWVVGDEESAVIIDAAHQSGPILDAVGDRRVRTILCTHGHNDHINVARELAEATQAPIALHPEDRMLWDAVYPEVPPDVELAYGTRLFIGGISLLTLHTPGHSPGGVCFYSEELGTLFSGDTLFKGGPGATGRSFSDFGTIIESIRERLLTLPPVTVVHTGHGDDTAIGAEAPQLDEWIARGH